ncbi:protein LURP-one-related 14 [Sesamum alatum]|uniref:Protein LURP-one-related 14 n=1 Tax=Sesamum alatum TaxID=300844 RepID=A0AAE1YUL9_9LAMI|nr:protein LURP-one-related 14 [Sesamum alatum]
MFVPDVRDFVPTVSVVGDDFCFPYLVDLAVKKKAKIETDHCTDMDSNLLNNIDFGISLQQQWTVHRGEGSEGSNLLYTVRKSHSFQLKTRLQVFLATNLTGDICDFRVIGIYISQSFKVYKGDTLMAEVNFNISF